MIDDLLLDDSQQLSSASSSASEPTCEFEEESLQFKIKKQVNFNSIKRFGFVALKQNIEHISNEKKLKKSNQKMIIHDNLRSFNKN